MNDNRLLEFNPDEYEDSIKDLSNDIINSEIAKIKEAIENEKAILQTKDNMIDRFIDEPGMEHLTEVQLKDALDSPKNIHILQRKISILETILHDREEK